MTELDVTWDRVARVWWAASWRSFVYMLPALLGGFVGGIFLAVKQMPLEPHAWKFRLAGGVYGLVAGIWVFKVILRKPYTGFRIALIAVPASTAPQAVQSDVPGSAGSAG